MTPRRWAAVGGGERGGGATKLIDGPYLEKKEKEASRPLVPTLVWAGVQRGGKLRGGRRRQWRAAALGLGRGPCGDGGGLWSSAARERAFLKAWQGGGGLAGRGRRPASGDATARRCVALAGRQRRRWRGWRGELW